jgi:hypothetical protein
LVDLSWFLYRTGNYVLQAVYDAGSVHDQLGSPLLEAGELKMKMVEGGEVTVDCLHASHRV